MKRGATLLELTTREFELLEIPGAQREARGVAPEMLVRDVWKETARATPLDNVIDVHMTHLRRKVDQDFTPKLIHTVRGVGFMLGEREP